MSLCVREGVLLEEAVRTCLGKEGELALIDEEAFNPIDPYDARRQRSLAFSQSEGGGKFKEGKWPNREEKEEEQEKEGDQE